MVEEANRYYKHGIYTLYSKFKSHPAFTLLHVEPEAKPTAQDIISAVGVASSGKPHEGGIEHIAQHLEKESEPFFVRYGKWDRLESCEPSLATTLEHELEDGLDLSSPACSSASDFGGRETKELEHCSDSAACGSQAGINSIGSAIASEHGSRGSGLGVAGFEPYYPQLVPSPDVPPTVAFHGLSMPPTGAAQIPPMQSTLQPIIYPFDYAMAMLPMSTHADITYHTGTGRENQHSMLQPDYCRVWTYQA